MMEVADDLTYSNYSNILPLLYYLYYLIYWNILGYKSLKEATIARVTTKTKRRDMPRSNNCDLDNRLAE